MKVIMKTKRSSTISFLDITLLGFLLFTTSCSTPVTSHEPTQEVSFLGNAKLKKTILKNGLTLIVLEDHSSPTFAYQTWYKVGSRYEIKNYTGLAHLFEHMMFKGTKKYPEGEFDKILESLGAEGENAFTSKDYTAYVQELPKSNNHELETIIRLESDRMINLIVDEHSFKTETEVVHNERRMRSENNPDGLMYQTLFETAFQRHAYRWPTIGYEEDLNRMHAEDAKAFYKSHYAPNRATVVIVGDVTQEETLPLIQKYYGSLPAIPKPVLTTETEPEITAPIIKKLPLNMSTEKLMLAYPIPANLHPDIPALQIIATYLAGGKGSRLYQSLVDSGISTSIDSYDLDDEDPTLFIFASNLQKGKSALSAENVILNEIKHLIQRGLTSQELKTAKNQLKYQLFRSLDTSNKKAHFIGMAETISGGIERGIESIQAVEKVNESDITRVAKKYLNPNKRIALMGVPKK
jgi:zinc protease